MGGADLINMDDLQGQNMLVEEEFTFNEEVDLAQPQGDLPMDLAPIPDDGEKVGMCSCFASSLVLTTFCELRRWMTTEVRIYTNLFFYNVTQILVVGDAWNHHSIVVPLSPLNPDSGLETNEQGVEAVRKKTKRVRLLLDSRTELTNEELQVSRDSGRHA